MMDPTLQNAPAAAVPAAARFLASIGQLYNSRLQIEELVRLVAKLAAEQLAAECVFFWSEPGPSDLHARGWFAEGDERARRFDAAFGSKRFVLHPYAPLRAARDGRSTFLPVLDADAEVDAVWHRLGVHSLLAAPVATGGTPFGVLYALRPPGQPGFTAQDLLTLEAIAPQAARALANATLLAEERWQRQKAELMFQASRAIHTELNFDQAVREIALLLKQSIRSPWVGLFELVPGEPRPTALRMLGSTADPAIELRLCGLAWDLAAWPEAAAVLDTNGGVHPLVLPPSLAKLIGPPGLAWCALPLAHKLGPQGLLVTCNPGPETLLTTETSEVSAALAELVALAIMNQHLIEQEARARIQIIRSQAAAQEREVLLRQIVHDLRNATQAMSLVVEDLAIAVDQNPEAQAGLVTLDSQITFISNFLKEKLRWIQHGDRHGTDPNAALAAVFLDLQARFGPSARAKQQRLVVSAPEPIMLAVSAVQLEQIVGNLLDNAIKYTPAGGEIRLRADHSDGWVTIFVADDGPGIPPLVQAHLGEVGYRGQAAGEGAGLGLANVRQLVTQAGGLFGFSSRLGVGATFHVSLPTTLWGRVLN